MHFLRCFECCSTDLEEEYEASPPTCKGCGVIGNVEKIPTPNNIADSFSVCHVEDNFQLREYMINFAKELEDKKDLSDWNYKKMKENTYEKILIV